MIRLNKFLARHGIGSRRYCDKLISEGNIKVNDKVIIDFSYKVTKKDIVEYNSRILGHRFKRVVYIVNKPKGYISTSFDEDRNRNKVVDIIKSEKKLFTIGRLDKDTTGLILVTNDGDLSYKLTHPKFLIKREYIVKTNKSISFNKINNFKKGIRLEANYFVKGIIKQDFSKGKYIYYKIILHEGKNREIRRVFDYFQSPVIELVRISFANIKLGNLAEGKFKKLSNDQIKKKLNKFI